VPVGVRVFRETQAAVPSFSIVSPKPSQRVVGHGSSRKGEMLIRSLTILSVSIALPATAHTQGRAAAGGAIHACTVLPPSEVKRLTAQPDPLNMYDKVPLEEQPVGRGSSCSYPNVVVQIDPFDWTTIDSLRVKNPAQFEAVPGVGEAAYMRANKAAASLEFAELYARIGTHVLTLQMDVPDGKTTASVKPSLVALAQAYAAKLR
jgi:hypothetical protein